MPAKNKNRRWTDKISLVFRIIFDTIFGIKESGKKRSERAKRKKHSNMRPVPVSRGSKLKKKRSK